MDTHHGVVDGWKDNIFSFTLIKKEKGKQHTKPHLEQTSMVITVFNGDSIQTKHKYEIFGKKTNYSLFLSHICIHLVGIILFKNL